MDLPQTWAAEKLNEKTACLLSQLKDRLAKAPSVMTDFRKVSRNKFLRTTSIV